MTDLSHIEGLKQGEQMYVVELLSREVRGKWPIGTVLRRTIPIEKDRVDDVAKRLSQVYSVDFRIIEAPRLFLCPECERPLDKVWKDAKQTEVSHLSCRNDDCGWSSKDRLQHPRKREEGTGRKSATWGT